MQQLNDNSSQYQLKPLGLKHVVEARAQHSSGSSPRCNIYERSENEAAGIVISRSGELPAS